VDRIQAILGTIGGLFAGLVGAVKNVAVFIGNILIWILEGVAELIRLGIDKL